MRNDHGRFTRTFANIRRGPAPTPEGSDDRDRARTASGEAVEEKAAPAAPSAVEQVPAEEPAPEPELPLLFAPKRTEAEEIGEGGAANESRAPMAEAGSDEANRSRSGPGEEVWEPSEIIAEILRMTTPDPNRDSQGVMTMIRQEVAYQQGKVLEEEEPAKPEVQVRRPIEGRRTAPRTPAKSEGLFSLPDIASMSLGWARSLLAIGVAVIAIVYVLSHFGYGGKQYFVHFTVDAPGARAVSVVGDFNGWDQTRNPLQRTSGNQVWETWVRIKPGRYRYAFIVDGTIHMIDPLREQQYTEDLQRGVSVLVVPNDDASMPEMIGDAGAAAATRPIPAATRRPR